MFERLDELIRGEMDRGRLAGLAVALVQGDQIVWSRGYGYADLATKEPVTPSIVFAIQSVTKPVLATALLQWCERGCLQLDDPVNRHLTPITLRDEQGAPSPATVRQLLTHTSGLPVDLTGASPGEEAQQSLERFVAAVARTVRPPGEEIVYANYGYDMIGLLIERFGGVPYGDYLREQIFEPLEMRSTCVGAPPDGTVARGYFLSAVDGERHVVPPDDDEGGALTRPAGALVSTVEDLARFLIAHLNGGRYRGRRVLREETVAEMHRLHARHGAARNGNGLGFKVDQSSRGCFIYHGGDGVAFTAFIGACPERRAGVVLLMNTGRAHQARSVIGNAALRCLTGVDALDDRPSAAAPREAERLSGRYVSNFWGYVADLGADDAPALALSGGPLSGAGERPSLLSKVSDGVYAARGGAFDGFELAFEFDERGRATSFAGGLYAYRFDRHGDVPLRQGAVDEEADVAGRWSGTVLSPYGPVPVFVAVADAASATVTSMSVSHAPLQACVAQRGRLAGQFDVSLPGLGDFQVCLRLHASGGKLWGNAYARGAFGEVAMPAELERSE